MDTKEYKILILEDNPNDAELMENEMRKGGLVFVSKRVITREDFSNGLDTFRPNLILSDYALPQFDGLSAFEIAKEKSPHIPFILVTGSLGDVLAVEMLKKGITDYILKDRLIQLVPAVERALRESDVKNRLDEKISELGKLTDAMMGRELKMVELKGHIKDIVELQKQAKQH